MQLCHKTCLLSEPSRTRQSRGDSCLHSPCSLPPSAGGIAALHAQLPEDEHGLYLGAGPCQDAADATQLSLHFTRRLLSPRTKPPTDNSFQLHPDLLGEEAAAGLGGAANNKGSEWKERGILDVFRNLLEGKET